MRRLEVAAVIGVLAAVTMAAAWLIGQAIPLGWDESVYASRSRSLLTDIPTSTWRIYRPPGLPLVGLLGGIFGFTDANLRAVSVVLNLATLATAWGFARVLWGRLAAFIALLAIVGSPVVVAELARFHTDLPAAGLLLGLMLLLWYEFERRPEPSRLLLAAAPIAAMAFYMRYGSILALGGIGIAAVLLWHRPMLRRWRLVGGTAVITGALFVPHILDAMASTGSPVGILTSVGEVANTWEPLATAARYLTWLPAQLAHRVGFVVMLAGAVHAAIVAFDAIRRRALTPAARRFVWLYVSAGITALGLVLTSHPEQRYVLFPVLLAIVAGAGALAAGIAWLRQLTGSADRQQAIDWAVVGGILLLAVIVGSIAARRMVALEREGDRSRWLPAAGLAIAADADGPCAATTSLPPIIEWYSRCQVVPFTRSGADALAAGAFVEPTYMVFSNIDERRASAETIARYRELVNRQNATIVPVSGATPAAEVYRLTP